MGLMKTVPDTLHIPKCCIGPSNKVGIWLGLGPLSEYIALRAWSELSEVLVGSSCNASGKGNPIGKLFTVEALDEDIVTNVDYVVTLRHWGEPHFDNEGRWAERTNF